MFRIRRYIVTEILEVFFAVMIALILIMTSFQFAKLLSQAANGSIAGSAIYKLVLLQSVNLFVLLTPFAFFIACLIVLSKLASDYELIAMRSLGYSLSYTYKTLFAIALPIALGIIYITLFVLPKTVLLTYELTEKAKKESELSIIQPGSFRSIGSDTVIFAAKTSNSNFSKFFIWQRSEDGEAVTIAENGKQITENSQRYIELFSGSRLFTQQQQESSQLMSFDRLLARIPNAKLDNGESEIKSIPTEQLLSSNDLEYKIELQKRISPAISIILLALFSPLLIQFNPRENKYGKFVIAILVYLIYTNSQYILQALIENHKFSLFPGVYTSHILFLMLLSTLYLTGRRN